MSLSSGQVIRLRSIQIFIMKDGAPTLLGSVPDMDSKAASQAINSAVAAFDRGKGDWPTMKVKDRIACMNDFCRKDEATSRRGS